ncbi:MAG: hypothetical protein ACRD9Y_05415, partial [Blastocatellia bacterium]
PQEEREKLRALLNRQSASAEGTLDEAPSSIFIPTFDSRDPEPSLRWIEKHRREFVGQYVALDGDRLMAHGVDAREVIAAVQASGLNGLFFTLIAPADAPPFAGF